MRWAVRPHRADGGDMVLVPAAGGGLPLVFSVHTPAERDRPAGVTVAVGDPAVAVSTVPDCGCDACDEGSAALLEELDRWVVSVVDGSLAVQVRAGHWYARSSFGSRDGACGDADSSISIVAEPWPPDWVGRALLPENNSPEYGGDDLEPGGTLRWGPQ
nr:DUF6226 family protein [Nocardia farcinica]